MPQTADRNLQMCASHHRNSSSSSSSSDLLIDLQLMGHPQATTAAQAILQVMGRRNYQGCLVHLVHLPCLAQFRRYLRPRLRIKIAQLKLLLPQSQTVILSPLQLGWVPVHRVCCKKRTILVKHHLQIPTSSTNARRHMVKFRLPTAVH